MSPISKSINKRSFGRGFTLIELLVVIAIIGVLASVVLASLNSAREKGKIAAIKSTLKNMQTQAEITYSNTGSYASTYDGSYNCIGPLANMAKSLTDQGVTVKCYSRNDSSRRDVYLRFGATAIIYSTNDFKAWSTDQTGVVAWDQKGVNALGEYVNPGTYSGMTFAVSTNACAIAGGRLPSIEQLFTLGQAYGAASFAATGTTTYQLPGGFVLNSYWSSTLNPSDGLQAYMINFYVSGIIGASSISNPNDGRCVR